MSFFKSKSSFLFVLFLYTFLLSAVLLYFRFPAEKVKLYCEVHMEQLLAGTDCSIEKIRYSFPFSIALDNVGFRSKLASKQELFSLDHVFISPDISEPTSRFETKIDAFGGKHSFTLIVDKTGKKFTIKDLLVKDLDPTRIPFLSSASGREITGTVAGSGDYHGAWKNGKYEAAGKGNITLADGRFGLLLPILSLNSIDLKKFTTELELKDKKLQCNNGKFNGKELKGTFSGTLGLGSTLKAATLSFNGEIEALPELLKKSQHAQRMITQMKKQQKRTTLPFYLQGIVQKPSFLFGI